METLTTEQSCATLSSASTHLKSVELVRLNANDQMEVVHYHGRGTRTIVAIPGLGSSALLFESILKNLPTDLSLMIVHHRGIGRSARLRAQEDIHSLTDELVQFLEVRSFENCQKFDLLGVSYGGFLAQLMMLKSPALFRTLALFCTSSGGAEFRPLMNITDEALKAQDEMEVTQRSQLSAFYTTSEKTRQNQQLFAEICEFRKEVSCPLETLLWQNKEAKAFLSQPLALDLIKAPTLVMAGAEDRVVPATNSELLAKKITNAKCRLIEKTDHLFFMEKSNEVMKIYRDFLLS